MRILIVEDEPMIARRIARLLEEICGDEITYRKIIHDIQAARTHLMEASIDLLFLDLNLNGRDGFDLLKTSVSGAFHTIIISAHADQALRAFEYGVFDFIGKPFNKARLQKAINRLHDARARADYAAKYLSVRKAGRIDLIAVEEVVYVKGAGSYAELVLTDGTTELHDKSLDKLLALLPPIFERIHRSYLVNMREVVGLTVSEGSRYTVELKSGEHLPVGRTRYKQIRAKLDTSS